MFRSMYGSRDILANLEKMNKKETESLFSPFHDYLGLINLIQTTSTSACLDSPSSDSGSTFEYPFLALSERHRMDSLDSDAISDSSSSVGSRSDSELMYDNFGTLNNEVVMPSFVSNPSTIGEITGFNQSYAKTLTLESIIAHQNNMLNRLNHVSKDKSNAKGANKASVCVFCRNNGESREFYSSHTLKDNDGNTTCPILRAYTCPLCKANGDNSHTIKYCPKYTPKLKTDKLIGLSL